MFTVKFVNMIGEKQHSTQSASIDSILPVIEAALKELQTLPAEVKIEIEYEQDDEQ